MRNSKLFHPTSIFSFLVAVLIYIPLITVVIFSFNSSPLTTVWGGFSFKPYSDLFANEKLVNSLLLSAKIASGAASGAVILGTITAVTLSKRKKFIGKSLMSFLLLIPLVLPEIITAAVYMVLFSVTNKLIGWPYYRGLNTIILAHTTIGFAYVTMIVSMKLSMLPNSLQEAALDLGAKPIRAFISITLPNILPAIIISWVISFILSFDDLVIANFNSGSSATTLPMEMYSSLKLGVKPYINAVASIIFAVVIIASALLSYIVFRSNRYDNNE